MQTILLIGGSGFIGANLIEFFSKEDYRIINFSRSPGKIKNENVIDILGDCKDTDILNDIFSNYHIDLVLHTLTSFSAMDVFESCQNLTATNLASFIDLTLIMHKYKVNKIIYVSSGGSIYGTSDSAIKEDHQLAPVSFYGWMKEASESYLAYASRIHPEFKYLILRPANVYGKYQKLDKIIGVTLKNAQRGIPMNIYGDVNTKKDYIHIDDFCEIVYGLVSKNSWNEVYNIASGVGTSTKEILEYAQEITGKKISISIKNPKMGDVSFNVLNVDKIKRALEKHSYISVREGMQDMYKYVLKVLENESNLL
ncbi:NAD-dependent epimerase/dehydratase family protein [Chimaeribacter arupi]|uniref:NAD-dependent epimerase/dehydratase family protein n=1 Tax=Chimaeribacter arupi TaxID=2060066 RepID=UPI000C7BC447|nr:NAD-dependent epimerase/dehydratase family protein [Chimaeribacter arupi]PLR29144.1 NAD-dependent dehydratase [Chimaeribacter arupi]